MGSDNGSVKFTPHGSSMISPRAQSRRDLPTLTMDDTIEQRLSPLLKKQSSTNMTAKSGVSATNVLAKPGSAGATRPVDRLNHRKYDPLMQAFPSVANYQLTKFSAGLNIPGRLPNK